MIEYCLFVSAGFSEDENNGEQTQEGRRYGIETLKEK